MDIKDIQKILELVKKNNLDEFVLEDGDFKLCVKSKVDPSAATQTTILPLQPAVAAPAPVAVPVAAAPQPAAPVAAAKEDNDSKLIEVKSPIVGTFYRSSSPEKGPYVKVGDKINEGDVVCIVEAMKLFNEIESEVSGTIVKVLVEDAQPIEYDQALFLVDPNA